MPLGVEVSPGPGDTVLGGNLAPFLPLKGGTAAPSHFLAHVYRGQTAGWITMPLGPEVGRAADLFTELRNISRSKFYRIRIPL